MNSSSILNAIKSGSRSSFFVNDDRAERDNSMARYNRVAMVEAVLSIRDRRQRTARILAAGAFMMLGFGILIAGVLGWL